jgi:hypothetical protein
MALLDIGQIYGEDGTSDLFKRFQAACLIAAKDIKTEDPQTALHEQRMAWADVILQSEPNQSTFRVLRHLRYAIATNAAFQAAGVAITDNDIQFIINSQVNVLL